ncbi:hypothetical protein ABIA23_000696 [Sinorhizobium fredii]
MRLWVLPDSDREMLCGLRHVLRLVIDPQPKRHRLVAADHDGAVEMARHIPRLGFGKRQRNFGRRRTRFLQGPLQDPLVDLGCAGRERQPRIL